MIKVLLLLVGVVAGWVLSEKLDLVAMDALDLFDEVIDIVGEKIERL